MSKTFLAVLLLLTVAVSSISVMAPRASACWWLFGCNSPPPVPTPTSTPVLACVPGSHRCTTTVAGCVIEDCVSGSWVHFRTTGVACEVTGIQPTCFPSRL